MFLFNCDKAIVIKSDLYDICSLKIIQVKIEEKHYYFSNF